MHIVNHENQVVRTAFAVDSNRINHYDDVIEMMVATEIERCKTKENFIPTKEQIEFYKKELVRHMTIGRNIPFAQTIKIAKSNILNETNDRISPWA